jgi:MFS family permease
VIMGIGGLGIGCSFAVMPRMIVSAVPPEETSSALAANQVVRTIGYAVGSALAATILTAHTVAPEVFPTDAGYTTGCLVAIGLCLLAALLSWVLPHRRVASALSPDQELEIEEDVDAAISGTITLEKGVDPPARTS